MSLIRQLAGQTMVYGLGHIISKILYFVILTTYLTNRLTDTAEYGIYAEMYAYASLLIVFLSYRIDTAFFRFGSKDEKLKTTFNTAFIPLIFTTSIFVIAGIFFSQDLAQLIGHPDRPQYITWFSLILGFDVLVLLPYARLRLENRPMKFIFYRIFNIVLTILLVLFFLEFLPMLDGKTLSFIPNVSHDVEYVFIANLIASALLFLVMIPVLDILNFKVDWQLWKKMFYYSWPLIIVGVAGSFNQFFAVPLQKFLLGNSFDENLAQAGIYAAPQRIAALLALFTTAFNYAAEPFFFKNADRSNANSLYGKICLLFVIVAGLVVLGIYFYLDIFQFLIGKNYRAGLVIIPILLFAYLLLGIYYNISIWYKLADKTLYGALISTSGAVITLALNMWLLPTWGYIASAWAALATYTCMNIMVYLIGQKIYPIDYPVKKILLVILILVGFILVAQQIDLYIHSIWMSFSIKTIMLFMYLFIVYKIDRDSITQLLSPINKNKSSNDL